MKNDFMIIGLTGQSGAGKTTVSKTLESLGVGIVNADSLAHNALKTDKCKQNLRKAFGAGIFDENGEVARKALAAVAFSSPENTKKLNEATHPVIAEMSRGEFDRIKSEGKKAVLFDAPTLFESGLDKECDVIVSVIAKKETRAQRIMERDGISFEAAMLRLNAQKDDGFYTEKSDFVIENNGVLSALEQKAENLFKELFYE